MPSQNFGNQYEDSVKARLNQLHLLPKNLHNNDAGIIYGGKDYYIEIKNRNAPDFGQSGLTWSSDSGWRWRRKDIVTDLFEQLNITKLIDANFIPRRYQIPQASLTSIDRAYDQEHFEKSGIELPNVTPLFEYYARKDCYYIQIERKGFYHLKQDIANFGTPQLEPETITLRFRAKTHHAIPIHAYSFFVTIQLKISRLKASSLDLDQKVGKFPIPIL
jgi:hypothetical protein